mmetsp:Transcript_28123/g.47313  ORF Transcript_28123/g.47313 Transcript_28123/m.47313 type:complete len:201 (-) Transcript_28123:1615-2217(-)
MHQQCLVVWIRRRNGRRDLPIMHRRIARVAARQGGFCGGGCPRDSTRRCWRLTAAGATRALLVTAPRVIRVHRVHLQLVVLGVRRVQRAVHQGETVEHVCTQQMVRLRRADTGGIAASRLKIHNALQGDRARAPVIIGKLRQERTERLQRGVDVGVKLVEDGGHHHRQGKIAQIMPNGGPNVGSCFVTPPGADEQQRPLE